MTIDSEQDHVKTRQQLFFLGASFVGALTLSMAGCNKPAETTAAVAPVSIPNSESSDLTVTAAVKASLLADPTLAFTDLKVDTHDGAVQLNGSVAQEAGLDHAAVVAHGVAGVRSVDNRLTLTSAARKSENSDDKTMTSKVKTALLADTTIKNLDIAVVATKGDVRLSGEMESQAQIDEAIKTTRAVDGVQSVQDQLSIKK